MGLNTDDSLSLNISLKFPTLAIIVRCFLKKVEKFHQQIYLGECLYEL